ncbi:hypothetical protein ACFX14_032495 [Malus domestica]
MIKWAITLGEFDISYQPKPTEKGLSTHKIELTTPTWSLYVDGSSNQQGCGAGLVLTALDKVAMEYALHFKFKASNNEAEYEALIAGLCLAKHLGG